MEEILAPSCCQKNSNFNIASDNMVVLQIIESKLLYMQTIMLYSTCVKQLLCLVEPEPLRSCGCDSRRCTSAGSRSSP